MIHIPPSIRVQITSDKLTCIASENWSGPDGKAAAFSPDLVKSIYMEELGGAGAKAPSLKRIMVLEISQVRVKGQTMMADLNVCDAGLRAECDPHFNASWQ